MPLTTAARFEAYIDRLQRRLPERLARALAWARRPGAVWIRVPLGFLFILGGVFSILPVLGLWMLPLGVLLIAHDVQPLQKPLVAIMDWADRNWPRRWR